MTSTWATATYRISERSIKSLVDHGGVELAGHLSFTAMFAMFPFLVMLATLAGLVGDVTLTRQLVGFLFEFTPDDVAAAMSPAVHEVISRRPAGLLPFGLIAALWVAAYGFEAVRAVLNSAYGVTEPRPFWWRILHSLAAATFSTIMVFVTTVAVLFKPYLWSVLDYVFDVDRGTPWAWTIVRTLTGTALAAATLLGMHRWLPAVRHRWLALLPGVVATVLGWMLISTLFSLTVGTFFDYTVTYGGLAGVMISLLFFYLLGLAFILGAELNAELARDSA